MTDFELGSILAFKKCWPQIEAKDCMFHFGQSIMKMLNTLGLKTEYIENIQFQKWIKMIFTLAIIPIDKISDQWEIIMQTKPQVDRIDEFTDYFVDNYF